MVFEMGSAFCFAHSHYFIVMLDRFSQIGNPHSAHHPSAKLNIRPAQGMSLGYWHQSLHSKYRLFGLDLQVSITLRPIRIRPGVLSLPCLVRSFLESSLSILIKSKFFTYFLSSVKLEAKSILEALVILLLL